MEEKDFQQRVFAAVELFLLTLMVRPLQIRLTAFSKPPNDSYSVILADKDTP
jgi:hypothetical protein